MGWAKPRFVKPGSASHSDPEHSSSAARPVWPAGGSSPGCDADFRRLPLEQHQTSHPYFDRLPPRRRRRESGERVGELPWLRLRHATHQQGLTRRVTAGHECERALEPIEEDAVTAPRRFADAPSDPDGEPPSGRVGLGRAPAPGAGAREPRADRRDEPVERRSDAHGDPPRPGCRPATPPAGPATRWTRLPSSGRLDRASRPPRRFAHPCRSAWLAGRTPRADRRRGYLAASASRPPCPEQKVRLRPGPLVPPAIASVVGHRRPTRRDRVGRPFESASTPTRARHRALAAARTEPRQPPVGRSPDALPGLRAAPAASASTAGRNEQPEPPGEGPAPPQPRRSPRDTAGRPRSDRPETIPRPRFWVQVRGRDPRGLHCTTRPAAGRDGRAGSARSPDASRTRASGVRRRAVGAVCRPWDRSRPHRRSLGRGRRPGGPGRPARGHRRRCRRQAAPTARAGPLRLP